MDEFMIPITNKSASVLTNSFMVQDSVQNEAAINVTDKAKGMSLCLICISYLFSCLLQ